MMWEGEIPVVDWVGSWEVLDEAVASSEGGDEVFSSDILERWCLRLVMRLFLKKGVRSVKFLWCWK